MLVVREAGERTFVADPGANRSLRGQDVAEALTGAAAVFVSGYPLLRPETSAAAMAAAEAARAAGIPAAIDAASWPLLTGQAGRPVLAAAALAGTLLANRDEAAALTGRRDPRAAAHLLATRVGTAVIKCGAAGLVVCIATGRPLAVPAPPADVVDVTGAGDACAAGYLLALAAGADPPEAAAWPPLPRVGRPRYP
jgi:sugar/nucleoside kinase (ribokinase family)